MIASTPSPHTLGLDGSVLRVLRLTILAPLLCLASEAVAIPPNACQFGVSAMLIGITPAITVEHVMGANDSGAASQLLGGY